MPRSKPDSISARALVLTPLPGHGTNLKVPVTLLIVLPDGSTVVGEPYWGHSLQFSGVIRPGMWVPVTLSGGRPRTAEPDADHIPTVSQVARVMHTGPGTGHPAADQARGMTASGSTRGPARQLRYRGLRNSRASTGRVR